MLVKCISDDRTGILQVLQRETGAGAVYTGSESATAAMPGDSGLFIHLTNATMLIE